MVTEQIERRGIRDPRILESFLDVPRHRFVSRGDARRAYEDHPLAIGSGQTISQPYMVALMTSLLDPRPDDRVLEIGTGSGYQTAILSRLVREVHSVERIESLSRSAGEALSEVGCENVVLHVADGTLGLPEWAPYDAILVGAGGPRVPAALVRQLTDGGRLVLPVGPPDLQHLHRIVRRGESIVEETLHACVFVKLLGADGWTPVET